MNWDYCTTRVLGRGSICSPAGHFVDVYRLRKEDTVCRRLERQFDAGITAQLDAIAGLVG